MADTGISGALTDGTGVSPITVPKIVKDFIADVLLSGAAAIAAVNIVSLEGAIAQPTIVAMAVLGSTIRVVYRFVLRWATTA